MARDEYIHRLLLNWARWRAGACDSGLGYGGSNWAGVRDERYREAIIPTIALEAEYMDRAVATLEHDLQRTIEVMYLRDLGTKQAAAYLRVAESTVKERVGRAHRKLAEALREIQAKAAAKRERLEAVLASARPPEPVPLSPLVPPRDDDQF